MHMYVCMYTNNLYTLYVSVLYLLTVYFRAEITDAVGSGAVSRYVVSYSRYQVGGPLYVQDNMRVHGEELSQLIMKRGAVVYVCG